MSPGALVAAVPVPVVCFAALLAQLRLARACLWAIVSLGATGVLLLLFLWFAVTVTHGVD